MFFYTSQYLYELNMLQQLFINPAKVKLQYEASGMVFASRIGGGCNSSLNYLTGGATSR
jgi:hypothetical protein